MTLNLAMVPCWLPSLEPPGPAQQTPRHPRCRARLLQHRLLETPCGRCVGAREVRFGAGVGIRRGENGGVAELSLFLSPVRLPAPACVRLCGYTRDRPRMLSSRLADLAASRRCTVCPLEPEVFLGILSPCRQSPLPRAALVPPTASFMWASP